MLSSLGLGLLAVLSGILLEKLNIAFLVGLTFGIAASCNFPILILSMYWKGLTTGAVWGGLVGLVTATAIVIFSKAVWVTVLGNPAPLFPYEQPACSRCRLRSSSRGSSRCSTESLGRRKRSRPTAIRWSALKPVSVRPAPPATNASNGHRCESGGRTPSAHFDS